jgi:micrococcal nuclease
MYEYQGRVVNVVDGDTVDLELDLGFGIWRRDRFRLLGINAPERRGADKLRGAQATERLRELLAAAADGTVQVLTVRDKKEKYWRYLARIIVQDAIGVVQDVGATLLAEGLVEPYR